MGFRRRPTLDWCWKPLDPRSFSMPPSFSGVFLKPNGFRFGKKSEGKPPEISRCFCWLLFRELGADHQEKWGGRRYLKGLLHALFECKIHSCKHIYVYIYMYIHIFYAFPNNIGNGSKEITLLNHHVGADDPRTKDMKTWWPVKPLSCCSSDLSSRSMPLCSNSWLVNLPPPQRYPPQE